MMMMVVAASCIESKEDLKIALTPVILITLVQVPAGVAMILAGKSSLPSVFHAIQALTVLRRDERMSVNAFSGFASTPALLSTGMIGILFLVLAMSLLERKSWTKVLLTVSSLGLVFVIYLTVRRGMFLLAVAGLTMYGVALSRKVWQQVLMVFVVLVSMLGVRLIDSGEVIRGSEVTKRSDVLVTGLQVENRFTDVFLPILEYWIETKPVGSFLGNGGLEALAFERDKEMPIEVLAGTWVVEFGIVGAVTCVLAMATFLWRVYRLALNVLEPSVARTLALYCVGFFGIAFLKEGSAFCQVTLGQLVFWSIPGLVVGLNERWKRPNYPPTHG
jgi:hypothetical protein